MITKLLHIIFILLLSISTNAQINLVPNYSFEEKDSCGNGWRAIDLLCKDWFTPMLYLDPAYNPATPNNYGSSEYFNVCNIPMFSVPNNGNGFQYAKTGVAYAGFALLVVKHPPNHTYSNYKEYIEVELNSNLKKGKKYCVEFYYNTSKIPANYQSINIQALITDTLVSRTPDEDLWFTHIYANAQISKALPTDFDTVNWVKVEGEFIAKGGEKYLTIGNFDNTDHINNPPGPNTAVAIFIYVDDVTLWFCDTNTIIVVDSMIVPNVFTPNDDGYNDKFEFKNQEQWEYETQIFNRWGHLIFDNSNSVNWDGYYKSEKATPGVYYYVIQATAIKTGKVVIYRGTVTVLY